MKIKAKVRPLENAGNLKGFATVFVNGSVVFNDVRIMNGERGLFTALPSIKGKDGMYAHLVTNAKEVTTCIHKACIEGMNAQDHVGYYDDEKKLSLGYQVIFREYKKDNLVGFVQLNVINKETNEKIMDLNSIRVYSNKSNSGYTVSMPAKYNPDSEQYKYTNYIDFTSQTKEYVYGIVCKTVSEYLKKKDNTLTKSVDSIPLEYRSTSLNKTHEGFERDD